MKSTLLYFVLLGVALAVGYFLGRGLAKRSVRFIWLIFYLPGAVAFLVGYLLSDQDYRFRWLAITGLFLKVTAITGSLRKRRKLSESSVDLWAEPKHHWPHRRVDENKNT